VVVGDEELKAGQGAAAAHDAAISAADLFTDGTARMAAFGVRERFAAKSNRQNTTKPQQHTSKAEHSVSAFELQKRD